jgi:hypothetical protein
MTVNSTTSKAGPFTGNGVTTDFPFNFRILDEDHIRVIITDESGVETDADPSDYTVSGVGETEGSIEYSASDPLPTGHKLTILRNVPLTQVVDIANSGAFYPEIHESVFDKLTMAVQQVSEIAERAVVVPPSSSTDPSELIADLIQAAADAEDAATTAAADVEAQLQSYVDEVTAFKSVYLGAFTGNPTADNDGGPLTVGMLYFNTGTNSLRVYSTGGWVDPSTDVSTKIYYFLAGAGDTSVSGVDENGLTLAYSAGSLIVVLNGSVLIPGVDYVATTGTSITGISAMSLNDEVQVYAFNGVPVSGLEGPANLSDVPDKAAARNNLSVYSKAEVDSAIAAIDIDVPVTSVAGKTGAVTLVKGDVGLGNVANVDTTDAGNISSGTMGTARLGSGTASSSTYLRGDQTWATVTGPTTQGAVGTYALIRNPGPSGVSSGGTMSNGNAFVNFGSTGTPSFSGTPSGTWRNMGPSVGSGEFGLFLRIS